MSEYDAFAQDFDQTRQKNWPEFDTHILPLLKKGDRILDIGCGNGRLRKFISQEVIRPGEYFAIDLSKELIEIARKDYKQDHFFVGNMTDLPFGADNFEVVTLIASFHHLLTKKDQKKCLDHIYRVLKPGGVVCFTNWKLPKKYFWTNILRGRFKNWNIPFGKEKHPRTYRFVLPSEMKRLLRKHDFEILHNNWFQDRNLVTIARKKED